MRRAVLLLPICGALLVACSGGGGDGRTPAPPPDDWDARVAELVTFVEEERGLTFLHPVAVEFLPDEEFTAAAQATAGLTDVPRPLPPHAVRVARALGRLQGEHDSGAIGETSLRKGVAGYYDIEADRIVIRGDGGELGPYARSVVVHELTHALQDQRFGLDPYLSDELRGEARFAYEALVEGDARRIEDAYVLFLANPRDLEPYYEYLSESIQSPGRLSSTVGRFPRYFFETLFGPSEIGLWFVRAVAAVQGDGAIDAAFAAPPRTEEQIVRPERWLSSDSPIPVEAPTIPPGAREVARMDFGMLQMLLMLWERLGPLPAWTAAAGWDGGAAVVYARDEVTCISVVLAADDAAAAALLADAFGEWAATVPAATVRTEGSHLRFESCDPGARHFFPQPLGGGGSVFRLARARTVIIRGVSGLRWPPDEAACIADMLLVRLGLGPFTSNGFRTEAELGAAVGVAAAACAR